MTRVDLPRLVVAGLAGDSGKSLVSLGVVRALRNHGLRVAPYKKGPDFIDAAWLGAAAGGVGRNLDTYLMPTEAIRSSVARAASQNDVAVVEGNRGLFDGFDAQGSHSTAQLARLLGAPVVLVVDVTKATRTVAAQVLGCKTLEPDLCLQAVILNRVGTLRQEKLIRDAIWQATGVPVLGAIGRLATEHLPMRHLGLVTTGEHGRCEGVLDALAQIAERHLDIDGLLRLGRSAPALEKPPERTQPSRKRSVRIGVLRDKAFSFYYPENLSALEAAGARLIFLSPLQDTTLPALDALYAGGGFPEVHAQELSANAHFRAALRTAIHDGLPVWAECGGLIYLAEALCQNRRSYPMVGALPISVEQTTRVQGHGYMHGEIDSQNPFLPRGTQLRGHEFHYSRLQGSPTPLSTVVRVDRGVGVGAGRDGICIRNVVASYSHLHALGAPQWAPALVRAARSST